MGNNTMKYLIRINNLSVCWMIFAQGHPPCPSGGLSWEWHNSIIHPIGSMYAIYGNIYHQYTPNVSIYTIHGSYGHHYPTFGHFEFLNSCPHSSELFQRVNEIQIYLIHRVIFRIAEVEEHQMESTVFRTSMDSMGTWFSIVFLGLGRHGNMFFLQLDTGCQWRLLVYKRHEMWIDLGSEA